MSPLLHDIQRNLLRAAPLLLIFGAILALMPLIFDGASENSSAVAGLFVSYTFYRSALYAPPTLLAKRPVQRDGSPFPPEYIGRFVLVGIAHTLLTVLFGLGAIFVATNGSWPEFLLLAIIPNWLLLCTLGTLYPAAADGQKFSPTKALATARRTWRKVALQIALLPGLYGLVLLIAEPAISKAVMATNPSKPVLFVADTIATAFSLVVLLLTAVILTRAYREAWPPETHPPK